MLSPSTIAQTLAALAIALGLWAGTGWLVPLLGLDGFALLARVCGVIAGLSLVEIIWQRLRGHRSAH